MDKIFLILTLVLGCSRALPLENLNHILLGKYKKFSNTDPLLELIEISNEKQNISKNEENIIENIQGLIVNARGLEEFCINKVPIRYNTNWEREQVKRSIFATLQYFGIELSMQSLVNYAKKLNYSKEEFSSLTKRYVNNYCSPNITIISKKELINNFSYYFDNSNISIPIASTFNSIPRALKQSDFDKNVVKKEFYLSSMLFRNFCSWSNKVEDPRLLSPFLSNPLIASQIFQLMEGVKLVKSKVSGKFYKKNRKNNLFVGCHNYICRKIEEKKKFRDLVPLSTGMRSFETDLKSLYCEDLRRLYLTKKQTNQNIKSWIEEMGEIGEREQVGHFVSLITKMPDFSIRFPENKNNYHMMDILLSDRWDKWANQKLKLFSQNILFEEALELELGSKNSIDLTKNNFQLHFEVNLGELDKSIRRESKIHSYLTLEINRDVLLWSRKTVKNLPFRKRDYKSHVQKVIQKQIEGNLQNKLKLRFVEKFSNEISFLISEKILNDLTELESKDLNSFIKGDSATMPIKVNFYYGVFALKYINFEFNIFKDGNFLTRFTR